jgi:UDP-2,3-diacylglucosamine pyrophosphatase LpxH
MTTKQPEITQNGAVTSVHIDVPAKWEQWYLHVSDCHFDSVLCNREVMQEHFDEAVRRKARINIYGDWFDGMQGRFDPRRSMDELRPEYRRNDYYDYLVSDSANWLKPYAEHIDIMTDGNHEMAILKAANTNPMDRLVSMLRDRNPKCNIIHGGYGGWVRYMINMSDGLRTGPRTSIKIKYFHGAGGDAPVTRGVIQTNRQATYLPDANIVINGHSHNSYYVPIQRERLSNKGVMYFDTQHHIRIPGYKQSYGDGSGGWDVTRGAPPKPLGAYWVKLYMCIPTTGQEIRIQVIPEMSDSVPVSTMDTSLYSGAVYGDDGEGE